MSDGAVTKKQAGRVSLVAQAAGALLVAGAVIVVLRGQGDAGPAPEAVSWEQIQTEAAEQLAAQVAAAVGKSEEAEDGPGVDYAGLVARINMAAPEGLRPAEPDPATEVVVAVDDPPDEGPEDPQDDSDALSRFLGVIGDASSQWALVAVGDKQRILGVGERALYPDPEDSGEDAEPIEVRVVSISETGIEIEENGVRQLLEKVERVAPAISVSVAGVPEEKEDPIPVERSGRRRSEPMSENDRRRTGTFGVVDPKDYTDEDGTFDSEAYRAAVQKQRAERDVLRRERLDEARRRAADLAAERAATEGE